MKGGLLAINAVQLLHPGLYAPMYRILQYMPLQTGVMCPLAHLTEFATHKQHLLAGLRIHISEQQPQIGKFLPLVSWHFANQRAFAVNYFIM